MGFFVDPLHLVLVRVLSKKKFQGEARGKDSESVESPGPGSATSAGAINVALFLRGIVFIYHGFLTAKVSGVKEK